MTLQTNILILGALEMNKEYNLEAMCHYITFML